jgi:hypothetical protein
MPDPTHQPQPEPSPEHSPQQQDPASLSGAIRSPRELLITQLHEVLKKAPIFIGDLFVYSNDFLDAVPAIPYLTIGLQPCGCEPKDVYESVIQIGLFYDGGILSGTWEAQPEQDLFAAIRVVRAIPHLNQITPEAIDHCIQSANRHLSLEERDQSNRLLSSAAMIELSETLRAIDPIVSAAVAQGLVLHPADIHYEFGRAGVERTPLLETIAFDSLWGERMATVEFRKVLNRVVLQGPGTLFNGLRITLAGMRSRDFSMKLQQYLSQSEKLDHDVFLMGAQRLREQGFPRAAEALDELLTRLRKPARSSATRFVKIVKAVHRCQKELQNSAEGSFHNYQDHPNDLEANSKQSASARYHAIKEVSHAVQQQLRLAFSGIYEEIPVVKKPVCIVIRDF